MAAKFSIQDEEIINLLTPDLQAADAMQSEMALQREAYYKAFRMAPYGNERQGWSGSVSSTIYTQQQSTLAALQEIFSDEFFTLKGKDPDRATKFQKLINYQMWRKNDGNKRIYDFLFNAGLYHYAVFKVFHREDCELADEKYERLDESQMLQLAQDQNRQITKYDEVAGVDTVDPMTGQIIPAPTSYENIKVVRKDVKYFGPTFEVVQPWAFGYSQDCKITDWGGIEGRLVYHTVKLTLNDIRKREKAGIYRKGTFDKCKDIRSTVANTNTDQSTIELQVDGLSEIIDDGSRQHNLKEPDLNRELSVKECYAKLDIDKDGLLEHTIVTIIEDKVVAQIEENPYGRPPFRIGSMLPEPHKVHGIAPPSILEQDQKIQTNLLRFIQDSAAQSCYRNPVTNDPRMQQMLQERKPFDVIMGDPARLGEVKTSPPDNFVLKAWELLQGSNEEKTGNSRYNQGSDGDSLNKTATGISLISQASARRTRMAAKSLGNGAITGVIRDFIFINQKWPNPDPVTLLGEDLVINPNDLEGEYDIEIDIGVSPAERQAIANQIDLLLQFGTQAGLQMGVMKPEHIIRGIKKKFSQLNIVVDDLLVSEPEFKQQQAQQQQQQQQNPPPPPPEVQQAQMEMQMSQQEHQMKMQELQAKVQAEQQKLQLEMQQMQMEAEIERQKMAAEAEKLQLSIQQAREQHVLKMRELEKSEKVKETRQQPDPLRVRK